MGKVFLRIGFHGYQVGKGFLVFYIHLVVFLVGIFFLTGEGVSLIVSGLLGVSFLLGCFLEFLSLKHHLQGC